MQVVKQFQKLYSVTTNGKKVKQWMVAVFDQGDGTALLVRASGYIDQKITHAEKIISKGKNIGKANETTPIEQAIKLAASMQQKQLDKGHTTSVPDLSTWKPLEFPMLAHRFADHKAKIQYPCFVQPKFDGVRCFAKKISETEMTYTSRGNKSYHTLNHLSPMFLSLLEIGDIIDGEVYIHGATFQEIIRRVKKVRPESVTLMFHAYDFIKPNGANTPFKDRYRALTELFSNQFPEIDVCPTFQVFEEKEIYEYHNQFVKEGFEGVMIRNRRGKYGFNARSHDLQKYKEFIDDEFKIIGAIETDDGNHRGCVKFICETKDGKQFTSYPKGSLEQRRQMFIDREQYIGKQLTVRYQALSEEGVPTFNVGLAVRDYE